MSEGKTYNAGRDSTGCRSIDVNQTWDINWDKPKAKEITLKVIDLGEVAESSEKPKKKKTKKKTPPNKTKQKKKKKKKKKKNNPKKKKKKPTNNKKRAEKSAPRETAARNKNAGEK